MTDDQIFFVLDVESIGLHGEGFAVGYVVVNRKGETLEEGMMSCPRDSAIGHPADRRWVEANIPELPLTHDTRPGMLLAFWGKWSEWQDREAVMVADCGWPVEARFLESCSVFCENKGPYPLHELASFMLAAGRDPLASYDRLPNELPKHNPLCDARQSARLLLEVLS